VLETVVPASSKIIWCFILADRTNGRAYATVLRPSPSSSVVSITLCIVAKRCVLKQKLHGQPIGNSIWGIDWYQNEWPWSSFRGRL